MLLETIVILVLSCVCLFVVPLSVRQALSLRAERQLVRGLRADLIEQRRNHDFFRLAAEHSKDGLVIQAMDATVLWANPAYCRLMGLPLDAIIGRNPLEYALPPEDRPSADEIARFRYREDAPEAKELQLFRNMRANGEIFWNQINLSFRKLATGDEYAILVCRDVTSQIAQEKRLEEVREQLAHEATHDTLTGLANRMALIRFVRSALAQGAHGKSRVGLLHVDLDRFKEINDTHGHSAGDSTLSHVASVLKDGVRSGDLVARVGGDEFVVACPGIGSLDDLQSIADALIAAVVVPFTWNDRVLACEASIGAAISDPGMTDPEDLLLRSDFALYDAKRAGRNRTALYDEGLHQRRIARNRRAVELADAIDMEELEHRFQPLFDMSTGKVCGFETLVRWNHPEDGLVAPDDFLPIAAELGLMGEVDLASMAAALRMRKALSQAGGPPMTLSFNASPSLLMHPQFINRLIFGIEAAGIPREQIAIEVLETTILGDIEDCRSPAAVIRDLHDAGFQVILDDFGIGYAGLAHLAQLAVTGVKIDQSLIRDILRRDTTAKIVGTIIELCSDLGLRVVAEGVESAAFADRLSALGCDIVQGYWVAQPLAAEDVPEWLAQRAAPVRLVSNS